RVEDVPAESVRSQRAGSVALDEDVGAGDEGEQLVAPGRCRVVESDPALRYVQGQPEERALGILDPAPERGSLPGGVAPWRFDLDDVGAEITEHAPGEEPRFAGQIEHADAVEIAAHALRRRTLAAAPSGCQGRRVVRPQLVAPSVDRQC